MASYLPDAQIIWQGHTHDANVVVLQAERLSDLGAVRTESQYHIRTPSYKAEYGTGAGGWAVERKHPPKPLGCAVLTVRYVGGRGVLYDAQLLVR
jgi:hypothetical protein